MRSKPLRARLRKTCSESAPSGTFSMYATCVFGTLLAHVHEAIVLGLAPAAVVMRSDEDHADVELARHDVRNLEIARAARGGTGLAASARPRGAAGGLRGRASRARADHHRQRHEERHHTVMSHAHPDSLLDA